MNYFALGVSKKFSASYVNYESNTGMLFLCESTILLWVVSNQRLAFVTKVFSGENDE